MGSNFEINSGLGLLDVNLARVGATQEHLFRCDHIFLVANISRAITDQSLKSSLYAAMNHYAPQGLEASSRKKLQIAVVCTNSEVSSTTKFPSLH